MEHPIVNEMTQVVEPIMRQAGDLLLSYFRTDKIESKRKSDGSYVCNVDVASETLLKQELSKIVPEASFFAEESGISGNNDYRWVIDPLDGTTNFAHGIPHFCISVALTHNDEQVFGIIYQPILDELFWAQQGKGAWLNGDRMAVSAPDSFEKSLLVVGLPYSANGDYEGMLKKLTLVAPDAYGFRHFGAAALDLAYVACGRADGMFFAGLSWWDFAAGDLIVREAGGQTSDFKGNPITLDAPSCVAGGATVHKELLERLGR